MHLAVRLAQSLPAISFFPLFFAIRLNPASSVLLGFMNDLCVGVSVPSSSLSLSLSVLLAICHSWWPLEDGEARRILQLLQVFSIFVLCFPSVKTALPADHRETGPLQKMWGEMERKKNMILFKTTSDMTRAPPRVASIINVIISVADVGRHLYKSNLLIH